MKPRQSALPEGLDLGLVSTRLRPRVATVTAIGVLLLALGAIAALGSGTAGLGPSTVVAALFGTADGPTQFIVTELRLPRVVAGVLVGACLGVAGALTQTMARNPLATPDILGVTAGASLGAVTAIVLGGGASSVGSHLLGLSIPVVAIVAGLATAAAIYFLGWSDGVATYRFILIGIGVTAALGGVRSFLLYRAHTTQAAAANQWLIGSLSGITWHTVQPLAIAAAAMLLAATVLGRGLGLSLLGEELARSLGLSVQWHRFAVIAVAAVLSSAAVAAAGPVGFVAFVSPQVALFVTSAERPPLVLSGAVGATLCLAADTAGRAWFSFEVPAGIFTAIIGAPYLAWLLVRHRRTSEAV